MHLLMFGTKSEFSVLCCLCITQLSCSISSGAYVFLPRNDTPIAFEGVPTVVVAGLLPSPVDLSLPLLKCSLAGTPGGVQEMRLQFASWAGITYRLQPGMPHVDMVRLL